MENVNAKYIRELETEMGQTLHAIRSFLSDSPNGKDMLIQSLLNITEIFNDRPNSFQEFMDYLNSQEPFID
jgi:hypothetical protein